jgi:hypothetical protein
MIARSGWSGRWDALGRPFLHLPRRAAALMLVLLAVAMAWSAFTSLPAGRNAPVPTAAAHQAAAPSATVHEPRRAGGDMALYARIAARVAAGEGYYAAATAEHRASGYPTRPFVAVRLPTLARVQAAIGADGVRALAVVLTAAGIAALWRRAVPLGTPPERLAASLLLALGGGAAASPAAGYDHDFLAGLLLTFALLAWRPDRWWPALAAAAAALAVRELAVPFLLLWLAFAWAEGRRRQAGALLALLAVFGLGLWLHLLAVDAARLPGDLASQGWNALAGFGLPLAALGELTGLRFLPPALAAPLAILPLVGWAGLGGRLGLFATLWFAGVATMMALFARPANYYWIELALPAYALGLAFAPRAIGELLRRAAGVSARQT